MNEATRALARLACATVAWGMVCSPALAETAVPPVTVALDYAAPPACPDATAFQAIVSGRLGYDPFLVSGPERVIVTIAAGGRGTEGRMEWRDAGGRWASERTFPARGDDCGELARAMGFALALQIQFYAASATADAPVAAASATRPTTAPTVVAPPTPPSPPAAAVEQPTRPEASLGVPSAPARARPVVALGGGAAVGFGLSADAVPFARAFGALAWSRVAVELGLELGWPATVRRADGAGFSQQALLGSLAACATGARWSACALAKAGQLRIRGTSVDAPASPSGPLLETGARVGLKQALGKRLFVAGYVEGLALLTRWRVSLDGYPVWASTRFAETVGLEMGVSLP